MLGLRNVAIGQAEAASAISGRVIRVRFRTDRFGPGIPGSHAGKTTFHQEQDLVQLRRASERRMPPGDKGLVGQVPRSRHRDDHHQDWKVG